LQPACSTGWHDRRASRSIEAALEAAHGRDVDNVAVAAIGPDGILAAIGDRERPFAWASVTKLETALACLSDRTFGPWALEAWPAVSDTVLGALD
jgi:hypothetical protein